MSAVATAPRAQEVGTQEVVVGNRGAAFETREQTFVQRWRPPGSAGALLSIPRRPRRPKRPSL
eukprot:10485274-Lingulodinium_polyedra.AAC.1